MTRDADLQGKRVKIVATDNRFARHHIGKIGTVNGYAPCGMVTIRLDDSTDADGKPFDGDYWADPLNVTILK
jgi:hypothetical protein